MKCVFFGSPAFAVASLEALLASNHEIAGVITQPDRPAGRGMKLESPPVKLLALKHSLPVFQPEKVNTPDTLAWLKEHNPDVLVVVAYGEFLGETLLRFCKHPPINVHPSLLPDLRGAAPMQWALLRGYKKSGVSTQFMVKEMDAGDILLQEDVALDPNETAGALQERMKLRGGILLVKTLDRLASGNITPRPQDHARATFAPRLQKEQGKIVWSEVTAQEAHNLIRGLNPWPCAYGFLGGKRVKILASRLPEARETPLDNAEPGVLKPYGEHLFVRTRDSWLEILSVQVEGKRPMLPRDFANGMKSTGPTSTNRFED